MGKLADYVEQAKEVERLVQEERYSIEEALKIVKEKYSSKGDKKQ